MFYRHLVSLLNYFTFIILECQNEYSAKASNNIEQLRKRTNEPSSPSDSFFDLKDDSFAQELVKTYGEPHHSGTGQAGSLDKDDEVSSKAQEWKPPYVYKARKKSSEYDTSKTATASRNYLERIRSDPIKLERYRFKKAQIRSERLIKQGKVPFPRERRRIEVPFKELIQLEKDKIINEKQKEELAYHRAKRSQHDSFAGQLAKTFGNPNQAPVKPLTNLEPGEVNSMNSGKDNEYVYKPRKKESQYKKGKHVELVRSIQARVREDPIRREEVLQYKRHYYHARKNDPNFERKYHRFGSKILPLKELIKMEKNGTLNESQKEQLKHQRNLKKLQNQKQREKSRSNAQATSARSKDSKSQ